MNDVERLLQQDRMAGVPEPPDLRYTEAAVRRRLGRTPGAKGSVAAVADSPDWWMAASALVLIAPLAWLLPYIGVSPWWLTALPFALLPLAPLLVMKERDRS